ncbi:MAG: hypothetical protein JNM65_02335 [Verrucomicrobiaceae bacterium]|nr:hypothetical protein [Verrucomicrobiaceae bacterium]
MKALLITILLFTAAILVYDRFITPAGKRFVFENPPLDLPERESGHVHTTPVPRPPSHLHSSSPAPTNGGFVPPQIEPLESLTKNWTVFPPATFPRQIKLSKPVQLRMAGGSSTLPAGATAFAVGAQANVLIIAPTQTALARGQAFVHDTDMPAQVRESYERWKKGRVEMALAAWRKRQSTEGAPAAMPHAVDATGAPKRNADGSYDLLLASMKSGQVTDIKSGKIQRWGAPQARTIDNQPTWAVSVFYETMAFCGPLDTEAQAHVRDGRVVRWIYPGSGEPVP